MTKASYYKKSTSYDRADTKYHSLTGILFSCKDKLPDCNYWAEFWS